MSKINSQPDHLEQQDLETEIVRSFGREHFLARMNHIMYYIAYKMATDPDHCGGDPDLEGDIHCLSLLIDHLTHRKYSV